MKYIFKLKTLAWGALAAIALAAPACQDFDKINTDPTKVDESYIKPMNIATLAILRSTLDTNMWQRVINIGCDMQSQYFANCKYAPNTCVPNDSYTEGLWNNTWTWVANLNAAINMCGDSPEEQNIRSLCRIWRAWVYSRLTDYVGDIPYSQACSPYYASPKYDSQRDIYYDLVKELAEASADIDVNAPCTVAEYDVVFHGDWSKWREFANSLHLRFAMRMTEADPAKAKIEAEKAAAAEGGFLSEDVKIYRAKDYFTTTVGYDFFYPRTHFWDKELTLSTSMEKILTNLGGVPVEMKDYYQPEFVPKYADPRALIMYNVTSAGTLATLDRYRDPETKKWITRANYRGRWQGVKPGLTEAVAAQPENLNTNHARIGVFFVSDDPTPPVETMPVLQFGKDFVQVYANESYFLLAEAALRGWNVGGSAEMFYEQGIRKSMAMYGNLIKSADIESYLKSDMKNQLGTSVLFADSEGDDLSGNRNSKLMKIMTQKYIAGFPEASYEAWNDYRRLGMPVLDPFEMATPGFVMEVKAPDYKGSLRRFIYPAVEQNLNRENYNEVVARIGGDKTTTRMWWDARTTIVE